MKEIKNLNYWLHKLSGELPVLNIPTDYPRPAIQNKEGAMVKFVLSKEETANIKSLLDTEGLTLYMALLSVFTILLSKLSGQDDIIVGTPIAGRKNIDFENVVGTFVNMLAIRTEVKGKLTLKDFFKEIKRTSLGALENQDCQFEDLIENISVERDISRNPIFDVVFNLLNQGDYKQDLSELSDKEYVHKPETSKFDLSLIAVDYGEQITLGFEYSIKLFKSETIERFIAYIKRIIRQLPGKLEERLSAIELLKEEEKHQLLYGFNETTSDYPKKKTIIQLFEEQVSKTPDSIAVVYRDSSLTYSELNGQAILLAKSIQEKGIEQGETVGIIAIASIEMLIGILGILKAGCIYVPIAPYLPGNRIEYIIKDSNIKLLLLANAEDVKTALCEVCEVSCLLDGNTKVPLKENDTKGAYIIYTSGSTGVPKGVLIENRSLVNLSYGHNQYYGITATDRLSKYAGFGFDASVWEIFPGIIAGCSLIMIEEEIKLDVEKVNNYFEKQAITVSFLPTQMCEQFMGFDNKSLRILLTGGDKLNSFKKKNYSLYNNYGPTESTVVTTRYKVTENQNNIPIGKPIENTQVLVLDKNNQIQPIGVPGELCISGDGLAIRYINNTELTREKFISHPYQKGDRLYKTGDLVRWRIDGNIEFLGRIDHQVKIRGFRIELGEIENVLLMHEKVKECVVIAREDRGEKYLSAYVIKNEELRIQNGRVGLNDEEDSGLREFLLESLPDYMIPSYFIELEGLPLTPNGKIDRKALPKPEIKAGEDYEAPSNGTEEKLTEIWSEVLNIPKEEISVNSSFFALGGHSLSVTRLTSLLHKKCNAKISYSKIFDLKTIKEISNFFIKNTDKEYKYDQFKPIEKKEHYVLSSAQKRVFYLQNVDSKSISYNNLLANYLDEENIDKIRLEDIVEILVQRHESLRTSFDIVNDVPVQKVWDKVDFSIEYIKRGKVNDGNDLDREIIRKFIRPFDLRKAPLFRVGLIDNGRSKILLIDMHHIISDEWSIQLLAKEFKIIYEEKGIGNLEFQYKDYAEWLEKTKSDNFLYEQEKFWIDQLSGKLSSLELPMDFQRPAKQRYEGNTVQFAINDIENIRNICTEVDCTSFMMLLALYNILLFKISGQNDIIVGVPVSCRTHDGLEKIFGMFVNTLPIRNIPDGNKTFKEFLLEVKIACIQAMENQEYPFDDLVHKLGIKRGSGKTPIFNVLFNLLRDVESVEENNYYAGDKGYIHNTTSSMFDLSFVAYEKSSQFVFSFIYSSKLFKPETIEKMIDIFKKIVTCVINNTDVKLSDIVVSHNYNSIEKNVLQVEEDDFNF